MIDFCIVCKKEPTTVADKVSVFDRDVCTDCKKAEKEGAPKTQSVKCGSCLSVIMPRTSWEIIGDEAEFKTYVCPDCDTPIHENGTPLPIDSLLK